MNNHCEKLIESVKTLNKKITLDSLLDLCDDYDLTPAEVDWVTNQLSNFITDNDDGQNTENSNSIQHEAYVDLTDYSSAQTLNVDGLIELPDYYLSKDSGIVNVRIPDGVKSIGDYCFSDCPNLDTVVFPKSMMEIKNRAFLSCPKLRRFIFLGDLPDSLVVTPNIIIIHGDCEKSRYFKTQNESIIVMTRKSVRDWPHEVSNFAVVRGFIYSLRCNVDMLSRVIKDNTTYIQRHFEQLFYYAIVMHDRLILDYLYCQRLYPKKIHLDTFDILLYDDSIQKLRNLAQIESVYSNVHSGDIYSVKKEWAFKVVSKKEITTVQFKGTAIDCIQIPSSINGYPVTCIGANTFSPQQWGRRSVPEEFVLRRLIKRVILPDSIKKIDANAFDHCEYVTIYIPKSVENIDPLALGVSTMHNRYRLIVQKDSYAEQFAIVNDIPYELGILEAIQRSNPISTDDRLKITTGLVSQYAMLENAAKNAIDYWQDSVDVDILYRALNDADECRESRINSAESTARPAIPIKPQQNPAENLLKIESISQDSIRMGIRLQWKKQSEIECYEIWRAKESEQPVKIKEGSFPIPRYQDYDVEANCCYTYAIRGLNESGKDISHSADIQLIAPSKPPVFQIRELQFTFSGLQLKWSMLFEAEKYIVQKYSDVYGWTTLAELPVEQTMYLDAAAQGGKTIKYKIRCVCKNGTAIETAEIELNL